VVKVKRSPGSLLWFVLFGLVVAVWFYLAPSEEAKIKTQLEELANIASYDEGAQKLPHTSRYHQLFAEHLTDPITLHIAELGELRLPISQLVEGFIRYSSEFKLLRIRLDSIQVKLDHAAHRATVTAELFVTTKNATNIQRTEPRRFTATLEHRPPRWLLDHVKVSESRIDQPEARP